MEATDIITRDHTGLIQHKQEHNPHGVKDQEFEPRSISHVGCVSCLVAFHQIKAVKSANPKRNGKATSLQPTDRREMHPKYWYQVYCILHHAVGKR